MPDLVHPEIPSTDAQGIGSPEGVIYGAIGSFYLDTSTNELYWKGTDGTNTGWVLLTSSGSVQETFTGSGSPEGVVVAIAGRAYYWDQTDKVLYVKDGGTGNTGWVELIR